MYTAAYPKEVTQEQKDIAKTCLPRIEEALKPDMNPKWLRGRIATLLMHFYASDVPAAVQDQIARDWVNVLCGFRMQDIEQAVTEYLKTSGKKPTPFAIHELALKAESKHKAMLYTCKRILAAPLSEARPQEQLTLAERKRIIAQCKFKGRFADKFNSMSQRGAGQCTQIKLSNSIQNMLNRICTKLENQ